MEKILAAAGGVISERGADRMGMRDLADASGVPVATIYQYFGNREAVIATFLEREMEKLDIAMASAFLNLERVDMKAVIDTIADVHVKYHRENPAAVTVWFSGKAGFEVADRIRQQNAILGTWLRGGLIRVGLMDPGFATSLNNVGVPTLDFIEALGAPPDYVSQVAVRISDQPA